MSKYLTVLSTAFLLMVGLSFTAAANSNIIELAGGETVAVNCSGAELQVTQESSTSTQLNCVAEEEKPEDLSGQLCPDWVHDKYQTVGPDGEMYPTWHPSTDLETGCYFDHEHGADPRSSNIFTEMPPFGYIGKLAGMNMPHEGYKVFVLNRGTTTQDQRLVDDDHLLYFHMGTSALGRYNARFHEFGYVYDGPAGSFNISGLADTGSNDKVGSVCDRSGGRDFSTLGCNNDYEIWPFFFRITHPDDPFMGRGHARLYAIGAVATFDPITTRDPNDHSRLIYTNMVDRNQSDSSIDPLSSESWYRGCRREAYFGAHAFNNRSSRPTTYWTDVYGRVQDGPGLNLIEQQVGNSKDWGKLYKWRQDFCTPYITSPN